MMRLNNRDYNNQPSCWYLWKALSALFLMYIIVVQPAQSSVADGVTWLSAQQNQDGAFTDSTDVGTAFQSTAETLRTLYFLGELTQSDVTAAYNFLQAETHQNTANLSHLVIATSDSGGDESALIVQLLNHQNLDGGFGELNGFDSTVLDTALALEALAVTQQPLSEPVINTVHFLLSQQQSNGGWLDGENESSVYISALAMQALWYYRSEFAGLNDALIAAKHYLLSSQVTSGLWDETFKSALSLIALINASNEFSEIETLVTALRLQQTADGSWENSPYVTALVLRALSSQPTPLPAIVTTGEISGRTLNADTLQLIDGYQIAIDGSSVSITNDSFGNFAVKDVAPGERTIQITAPGYLEKTFVETVVIDSILGLGNITLSPLPTASVLHGVITDLGTRLPLEGAHISISGDAVGTATTGVDGLYSIGNLSPGDVSISVSKTGFYTVIANGALVAGNAVDFSPSVTPIHTNNEGTPFFNGTGALKGVVRDRFGQVIEGVTIVISGEASATTHTTASGNYSFNDLSLGEINITFTMAGYRSEVVTIVVVEDTTLEFNLRLLPEEMSGSVTISGMVIDKITQNPLPNVIITTSDGNNERVDASASNGTFLAWFNSENFTITFESTGYKSHSFTVMGKGRIDLQVIELEPQINDVTLYGELIDSKNGMPVANATVTIHGTNIAVQTDNAGQFRIDGLEVGLKTLIFSATGYSNQIIQFDFPENGTYQVNRTLNQSQLSTLLFTSFGIEQFNHSAYTDVQIEASVLNDSGDLVEASIEYTILNEQNQIIDVIWGSWIDSNGHKQKVYQFESGATIPLEAAWNTSNTEPGLYRLIARIVVGDSMIGPANITLAERVSSFSIDPTEAISALVSTPLPSHSGVGRTEQVAFQFDIVNRSNVETSLVLSYQLQTPDGQTLHEGMEPILLLPEEDNKRIKIEATPITFQTAGIHSITTNILSGTIPGTISGGEISVAPGIRIQPTQNIAPATVAPDENKRIRINIRLEGVELK